MDSSGILQWMDRLDAVNDKERIIKKTANVINNNISRHRLKIYNNSYNSLSDVFDIVFFFVKTDIAPDDNLTEQDIADYNSLMEDSSDLPLITYRCVKEVFTDVSCKREDFKYCEHFIKTYKNR